MNVWLNWKFSSFKNIKQNLNKIAPTIVGY